MGECEESGSYDETMRQSRRRRRRRRYDPKYSIMLIGKTENQALAVENELD